MSMESKFIEVVRAEGRRATWSPGLFVEAWSSFVDQVVAGYSGDLYEYENEVSVRDDLDRALTASTLRQFDNWRDLAEIVIRHDRQLQAVLDRGPVVKSEGPWWRKRLPPYAGEDLASDSLRVFGVILEAV